MGGPDTTSGTGKERWTSLEPAATQNPSGSVGSSLRYFLFHVDQTPGHLAGAASLSSPEFTWASAFPLHPDCNFLTIWRVCVELLVLIDLFLVFLNVAWLAPSVAWTVYTVFIYVVYACDLAVNLHTACYIDGSLVRDDREIKRRYGGKGRTKMIVDIVTIVPIALVQLGFGGTTFNQLGALALPRLLRVFYLPAFFMGLETNVVWGGLVRIIKIILYLLCIGHVSGCVWWVISREEGFSTTETESQWTVPETLLERNDFSRWLQVIYFALSIITGRGVRNHPHTDLETLYTIFLFFTSILLTAYVIGTVGSLLVNLDASHAEFLRKMNTVNMFMRQRNLPSRLRQRVRNYYSLSWDHSQGLDDNDILADLPECLRTDVAMFINREILEQVPLFRECDEGFLHSLVLVLRSIVFSPGEFIFREGSMGREMYFINKGTVSVVVRGTPVATISEGGFFGELSLLTSERRSASIVAETFCSLFVLTKDAFDATVGLFPEFKERFDEAARENRERVAARKRAAALALSLSESGPSASQVAEGMDPDIPLLDRALAMETEMMRVESAPEEQGNENRHASETSLRHVGDGAAASETTRRSEESVNQWLQDLEQDLTQSPLAGAKDHARPSNGVIFVNPAMAAAAAVNGAGGLLTRKGTETGVGGRNGGQHGSAAPNRRTVVPLKDPAGQPSRTGSAGQGGIGASRSNFGNIGGHQRAAEERSSHGNLFSRVGSVARMNTVGAESIHVEPGLEGNLEVLETLLDTQIVMGMERGSDERLEDGFNESVEEGEYEASRKRSSSRAASVNLASKSKKRTPWVDPAANAGLPGLSSVGEGHSNAELTEVLLQNEVSASPHVQIVDDQHRNQLLGSTSSGLEESAPKKKEQPLGRSLYRRTTNGNILL